MKLWPIKFGGWAGLAALAGACMAAPAHSHQPAPSPVMEREQPSSSKARQVRPIYAAIFEIKLDDRGKPTSVDLVAVIDGASGSTEPVQVPVPPSVTAYAREKYMQQTYEAGRPSVFAYEIFEP